MSRIDHRSVWAALLCLLLCLAALGAPAAAQETSQWLISQEMITAQEVNYKTETVRLGVFAKQSSTSGTEYYPHTYNLRFEAADAKFVEYLVKRGDEVKEGDALARFVIAGSEAGLASKRLALSRAREDYEAGKLARQEELAEAERTLAALTDRFDREIRKLSIERLRLSFEQYLYQQEHAIAQMQKEIDEIVEERSNTFLYAPADGVITAITYKKADDAVNPWEVLISMYRTDDMLLVIDNAGGNFRYNMPVSVEVGKPKERMILSGRIVAADDAIPEAERTGYAFVKLDPYDAEEINLRNPSVRGNTIYLENVLLLPRKATTLDAGKYFVTKLVDGMVQKRYVNYAGTNMTDAWLLQGVEEGETVIVD